MTTNPRLSTRRNLAFMPVTVMPDVSSMRISHLASCAEARATLSQSSGVSDVSERALEVAKRNAGLNGVSDRAEFLLADVMSEAADGDFYAVLSNPPYVKPEVYSELEAEIFHEPKIAFLGGEDGCDFYRELTRKYKDKISSDGFIAYEIGYDQADALSQIAEKEGLFCKIIKDYSGNDRVAVLSKSER